MVAIVGLLILMVVGPFLAVSSEGGERDVVQEPKPTEQVIQKRALPTIKPKPVIKTESSRCVSTSYTTAINTYLTNNNANPELLTITRLVVVLSELYDIDPYRPMSIIIHETDFGHSKAFKVNRNVCGLNWTDRQKELLGIKPNIYNLAVEKTIEASVTNLIKLLVAYRNFDTPLVTLNEIQTKYAPNNDPRNGLCGMDNSTWAKNTIHHYNQLAKLYSRK